MTDVLDQAEIDALLTAVETGTVQRGDARARIFGRSDVEAVEIRDYDFKRPERVSKDQMRALQTLHEAFARNFGASLSGFMRTIVEVKVAACEQMTYAEFISGLPNPTSFNLIEADKFEGQMCLEISPLIIYPVIDRLLGGTTQDIFIPQRPMTLIETRLISSVTNRGLSALAEAWAGIRDLTFEIAATESNPQLVQIVPPNEVVIVLSFELKMSNRAGTMNLCIPYTVIEPVMNELASQSWFSVGKQGDHSRHAATIAHTLRAAPLTVTGVLAETTITLRDLVEMQEGDLIMTETPASANVLLCVEGEHTYRGAIGQHKRQRALRIIAPIEPSGDGPRRPRSRRPKGRSRVGSA